MDYYHLIRIGLAVVAGKATRITDSMMMAAALALSELAPAMKTGEGRLLPELSTIRNVSMHIANAFILQGIRKGHIDAMTETHVKMAIENTMWTLQYESFEI